MSWAGKRSKAVEVSCSVKECRMDLKILTDLKDIFVMSNQMIHLEIVSSVKKAKT